MQDKDTLYFKIDETSSKNYYTSVYIIFTLNLQVFPNYLAI